VEVDAGRREHEVSVSAPGRRPFRTRIDVAPGTTAHVTAKLEPISRREKPSARKHAPPPGSSSRPAREDDDAPLDVFGSPK
jgi:hypothetical protein